MKNYIVEFIGTFFLVLVIGLTVIAPGAGDFAPIAIGFALMVMVYAGGPISGAHYNPAVTLAVTMRGKASMQNFVPYVAAQCLGAFCAAQTVLFLKSGAAVSAGSPVVAQALVAEFLFTFALAYVVLNVATSDKSSGNSYFGLAIGSTVTASAFAVGKISGGAFNPAVALGVTVMGLSAWGNIWIFFAANFAGAALAAVIYRIVNQDEYDV